MLYFHSGPNTLVACTFDRPPPHPHSTTHFHLSRFVFIIITHIDVHSVAGSPFVVSCSSVSQSKLCIESLSPPPQPNMRYSMRFFFCCDELEVKPFILSFTSSRVRVVIQLHRALGMRCCCSIDEALARWMVKL